MPAQKALTLASSNELRAPSTRATRSRFSSTVVMLSQPLSAGLCSSVARRPGGGLNGSEANCRCISGGGCRVVRIILQDYHPCFHPGIDQVESRCLYTGQISVVD